MSPNKKIRILISSYLNEHHKNRINSLYCIVYSLLYQTYKNFEIVIHHDGPMDDPTIPEKFEKIDNRIKFLVMPEKKGSWGFYDRWNIAVDTNNADWILFTNDDNYYTPKFLEYMLNGAMSNNADIVFCNLIHNATDWNVVDTKTELYYIDLGAYMTKIDFIRKTTWDDFSWIADYKYLEKLIKNGAVTTKIDKILFVHN
jgi:glycosyltransferase involved in cell wall biosynthesis